jgi:phospholipid transport system substrate-binding protein
VKHAHFPSRTWLAAFGTALALLALPAALAAQQDGAKGAVEALHETLLDGMKRAEELKVSGRFTLFKPAIEQRFNMRLMTAIASGKHWRTASEEERQHLVDAFTRFSTGTYAARFSSWSGESFETVGTRPGPSSTVIVDARIRRTGGNDPVALSYVVRRFGDRWQIVDVLLDGGISELAVKRSEFSSILAGKGVDGLVKSLTARTDAVLAKGA